MSNEDLLKRIEDRILKDFQASLLLEKKVLKELQQMESIGLDKSESYVTLMQYRISISYFCAYLWKLGELLRNLDIEILRNNINNSIEMRIKRMISVWKKNDINSIRKMRKKIGDDGVNLIKKGINKSVSKINEYISILGNDIKESKWN